MSFFLKSRPANKLKFSADKRRKRKAEPAESKDAEITSSEDEDISSDINLSGQSSSENEEETAQEKKLRLAKIYLEEIEREEKRRLEDKEISKELISQRLKEEHLKQIGKYEVTIADRTGPDLDNIKILKCREQNNTITCLCVSPNDQWIFSGSKDGVVVKWSLKELKKIGVIPFVKNNIELVKGHIGCIYSIAISSDNKFLVVGDSSGMIQVWDPISLSHIKTLKGHKKSVTALCIQNKTHTLYSASIDRSVRVWSLDEMAFVETLFGHQDAITSIDILNTDRPVTSGGRDGTIRLWKVSEESQLIFNAHPTNIDSIRLINDQHFISGGDDGQVSVWSSLKKKPLCSVKNSHGLDPTNQQPLWVISVASLVHSDLIASGSHDGYIRLWKVEDKYRKISQLFEIPIKGFINSLCFTSDGKYLIAGVGRDHRLGRWSCIKSAKNSICIIPLKIKDTT